ncbi:fatty acid desaturase [Pseudanabaena sp. BC1403]|uniref:fatty acid desaturase n=1 Tax=Pseudanabaena sp. BC1403 TaxID=2043171 RepID=UPI0021562FF9|nr:fatty acid desaturase [Pseudanabaena sp. BC1403]
MRGNFPSTTPNHLEVINFNLASMKTPINLSSENSDSIIHSVLEASENPMTGIAIALLIISLWSISLGFLLMAEQVQQTSIIWKSMAIMVQAFLYTGLFITAHDAMHGAVFSKHPHINYCIGSLSLLLYGLFSYNQLQKKHFQHHHAPASEFDPDFHDGKHKNMVAWYIYFMQRYWSWWQFASLVMTYYGMHRFLHIANANLILFWIIPTIISSMQIFYFGTFIPHREPIGGYQNSSRTHSVYRPFLWSFLTCYHFGYHQEHHLQPDIPWWKLPSIISLR